MWAIILIKDFTNKINKLNLLSWKKTFLVLQLKNIITQKKR